MLAQEGVIDDAQDTVGDAAEETTGFLTDLKDTLIDTDDGLLGQVLDFVPKLLGFLAILVIGYFVAKLIGRGVRKLFKKINFDYYMDKAGIGGPLERAGFKDSGRFVGKIIYYLIMLFVLKLSFDALDIDALNDPFDKLIAWIPKALVALILVVIGGLVAEKVKDIVSAATTGQGYNNIVTKVAFFGVWTIFGLAALDQIEIGQDLIDTLTTVMFSSLGAIAIIKYGVGGIWAARDRFWPAVYDSVSSNAGGARKTTAPPPERR